MADEILTGRTAAVTGGARGLGLAMALGLARAGANVSLLDVDSGALDGARAEIAAAVGDGRVIAVATDVSDEAAVSVAVAATLKAFDSLDIVVNDAGIGPPANGRSLFNNPEKFWENDLGRWRRTVEVNTIGSHIMAALAAPGMVARGWGRIVNVTTSMNAMYMAGCGLCWPVEGRARGQHGNHGEGPWGNRRDRERSGPGRTRRHKDDPGRFRRRPRTADPARAHGPADPMARLARLRRGDRHALPGRALGSGAAARRGGRARRSACRLAPARRPGDHAAGLGCRPAGQR